MQSPIMPIISTPSQCLCGGAINKAYSLKKCKKCWMNIFEYCVICDYVRGKKILVEAILKKLNNKH